MSDLCKSPWAEWETVRVIGRGSFGTVYEIRRRLVDGTVESAAMKVITLPQNPGDVEELRGEGYDDESITATFQSHLKSIVAEYTLMRKLDGSANVVNCKDIRYIQHDNGMGWDIFIRMELLTPLLKALPENVPEETVVRLGRDIASALVLCRKHNIIHRDIKPQNIFVSPNADYKLGDFGIAKTVEKTMGGTKIGTYKYMAPEVYNNQPYGSGADIYSLGLVLYWLLNERRMPFMPLPPTPPKAGQDENARQRRLSGEKLPPPAHGSPGLKQIVLKACAYDPRKRYHTAEEMLGDLNKLSGDAQGTSARTGPFKQRKDQTSYNAEDTATESVFGWNGRTQKRDETKGTSGVFSESGGTVQNRPGGGSKAAKKNQSDWKKATAVFCGIMFAVLAAVLIKSSLTGTGTAKSLFAEVKVKPVSIPFSTEIGNTVELGHYEQDGNTENGEEPIEWYVISKDEDTNMLLLLSKYGLDNVQYHSENTDITWADCDLRKWLNSEEGFWGTAFSEEEKTSIASTICRTPVLSDSDSLMVDGKWTSDKIFLPSYNELGYNGYLEDDNFWEFQVSECVLSQETHENEWEHTHYACWLRTLEREADNNYIITVNQGASYYLSSPDAIRLLRPVAWVAADGVEAPIDAVAHRPRPAFLNISLDEFEEKLAKLLEVASSWTRETAPQTLDEFPLCPEAITELYDIVKNAESEVKITEITPTDSRLEWKTNLLAQLTEAREEGYSTFYDLSWKDEKGEYGYTSLYRDRAAEIASDTLKKSHDIYVGCYLGKDLDIWHEQVQVSYPIEDGQITEKPGRIYITMSNSNCDISWSFSDGAYEIEITPSSGDYVRLIYDEVTRELVTIL